MILRARDAVYERTAPLSERFDILSRALPARLLMPRIVTGETAAAQAFYDDALQRGHEGVMAKSPSAPYEAGRRAASWQPPALQSPCGAAAN